MTAGTPDPDITITPFVSMQGVGAGGRVTVSRHPDDVVAFLRRAADLNGLEVSTPAGATAGALALFQGVGIWGGALDADPRSLHHRDSPLVDVTWAVSRSLDDHSELSLSAFVRQNPGRGAGGWGQIHASLIDSVRRELSGMSARILRGVGPRFDESEITDADVTVGRWLNGPDPRWGVATADEVAAGCRLPIEDVERSLAHLVALHLAKDVPSGEPGKRGYALELSGQSRFALRDGNGQTYGFR